MKPIADKTDEAPPTRRGPSAGDLPSVAMLGAFPPQAQGIMDYCADLAVALGARCRVTAIGFKNMYPALLYPGGAAAMDPTRLEPRAPRLTVEHRLAWYNPFGWIARAISLKAEALHIQWWSLPLWPVSMTFALAARRRGRRVVVTLHNVIPHERAGLFVPASRALCALAHRVIVHSETNRAQALERYGLAPEKVVKIPIGAAARPAGEAIDPARARAALGLSPEAETVLLFGAIRPYKGVEVLIDAFAEAARARPNLRLVIAGKPWIDWEPHAKRIEELGLAARVTTILEYVPEARAAEVFAAADLVVLPYAHFDAQSAVAAQAIDHNRPLIVSRVGGLPDWVLGEETWIVPPADAPALARAIGVFFSDREGRTRAFAAIAARVRSESSWDRVAEMHLEVYRG